MTVLVQIVVLNTFIEYFYCYVKTAYFIRGIVNVKELIYVWQDTRKNSEVESIYPRHKRRYCQSV